MLALTDQSIHDLTNRLDAESELERPASAPFKAWGANNGMYHIILHPEKPFPGNWDSAKCLVEFTDYSASERFSPGYVGLFKSSMKPHLGKLRWLPDRLDPEKISLETPEELQ